MRGVIFSVAVTFSLAPTGTAIAGGTAGDAEAMLQRAVAALRAYEPAALAAFTAGAPGYKDEDLYVFCGGEDGKFSAYGGHPGVVGTSLRNFVDKGGRRTGAEIYEKAAEGAIAPVMYMQPKPGEIRPSQKIALVTRVADQVCGVGYYE